jgi:hypothetical protein
MKLFFFLSVMCLLGRAAHASIGYTKVLNSGQYRFLLRLNGRFGDVYYKKIELTMSETTAQIDVEAPGYYPNTEVIELIEGTYQYSVTMYLKMPPVFKTLVDINHKPINNCKFLNTSPEHLYVGNNYYFAGVFPKKDNEKFNACNLITYVNGKKIEYHDMRVYLSSRYDEWYFEVTIPMELFDVSKDNHIELVLFHCLQNCPSSEHLAAIAVDYTRNIEFAEKSMDEKSLPLIQARLESNAEQLIAFWETLDPGEQKNIFSLLPESGDLVRTLKSKSAFAELYQNNRN